MKKWPIALQLFSVRESAQKDLVGTLRAIREMGYDGVELAGTYGKTAVEVKKLLEETGLELVSAHVPVEQLEMAAALEDYAAAGLKYVAIPALFPAPANEEELAAAVARIEAIARSCAERGMQLLYHNHDFEFRKLEGGYILDQYYARISARLLQTELDVCWVKVGGLKPPAYLRKYAGRAPVVHLKDYAGQKPERGNDRADAPEDPSDRFEFRPVGYGRQDIPSILAAAEEAGAQWLVVEQDSPGLGRTDMECAEMSVRYLRSLM